MMTDDEPDGMFAYALAISDPEAHRNDPNWPLAEPRQCTQRRAKREQWVCRTTLDGGHFA